MIPDDPFVLAGTGPRSLRAADRAIQVDAMERCETRILQRQDEHGDRLVVMSGMAEGWDELIAMTALRLGVHLWCAIPNRGYGAYYWQRQSVTGMPRLPAFGAIVGRASRVTYVLEDVYGLRGVRLPTGEHSNFVRNRFMVTGHGEFTGGDDFAVWGPESKGTAHCVREIKRAGKWRDDMVLSPGVAGGDQRAA